MSNLTVFRAGSYPLGFGMLDARVARRNLDPDQLGALTILAGLPDGWRINYKDLQKRFGAGASKVAKTLRKLESSGHLTRFAGRDDDTGQFANGYWRVHASPDDAAEVAFLATVPGVRPTEASGERSATTLDANGRECNLIVCRSADYPEGYIKFDARITYPESGLGTWLIGTLIILLGLPPNWQLNITDLQVRFQCGREKVATTLDRLQKTGHLIRCKRRSGGRFDHDHFLVFETVEDAAKWRAANPGSVAPSNIDDRLPAKIPAVWEQPYAPILSPDDAEAAGAAYNAAASAAGLAGCPPLRGERLITLSNRVASLGGVEVWQEAMRKIPASGWLTGRSRRRPGWKVDFDFLLQDGKALKLAEGIYDDHFMPYDSIVRPASDRMHAQIRAIQQTALWP